MNFLRSHGRKVSDMILNRVLKSVARHSLMELLSGVRSRLLDLLLEVREHHPELDENDPAANTVNGAEIDAAVEKKVYHNCTVFEGTEMGDHYHAGQAGAMGPGAKAENINFVQILREAIGDNSLADLASDLEKLRKEMLSKSKNEEQDDAVAAIAEAEGAAKKGDAKSVLSFLKRAGNWAAEVATKVGTEIAANAIAKSLAL